MALRVITPPAAEPVLLADAKTHLRVTGSDDDAYITGLIAAARAWAEVWLQRALITQTLELVLDAFPCQEIRLPVNPVQSITSIKYIDEAGVEQTLTGGNYKTDIASIVARIMPAYGLTWPIPRVEINAVTVRFIAGYGAAGTNVPQAINQAILLIVGEMYARREISIAGAPIAEVPFAAQALLTPYRNLTVA